MKSATTGALSGCVVWLIVFVVLSSCLLPVAFMVGTVTTTAFPPIFAAGIVEAFLCPPDSSAEIITHKGTGFDNEGDPFVSTSYEMQCVDSTGNVVREPSQDYVFIWMGILAVIGLVLSALIALLLAAPAGVFIVSLFNRLRKSNAA